MNALVILLLFGILGLSILWVYGMKTISTINKRLKAKSEKYNELLFSVVNKYPNETRHETALRYIREAEQTMNIASYKKD